MPGRLTTLRIDPRLMRSGSEAVCEAVIAAVNIALEELQTVAIRAAAIDTGGLSGDLERIQEESLGSARSMLAALQDAMDTIDRRA